MVVRKIEIPWIVNVDDFEVLTYVIKIVRIEASGTKIDYQFCIPNSIIQQIFDETAKKVLGDHTTIYILNDKPASLKECYQAQNFEDAIMKAQEFVKHLIEGFTPATDEQDYLSKSVEVNAK